MVKKSKKHSLIRNKRALILLSVGLIVIIIIVILVIRHNHKPATINTNATAAGKSAAPSNTPKNSGSFSPTTDSSNNAPTQSSSTPPASSGSSSVTPTSPTGTFVSNHGSSSAHLVTQNSVEASVCNTTPGVMCFISFTNSGVTKKLPSQTTDNSGATYWPSWTPKSVGLTPGNWTVSATATSGQNSVSTQDPNVLVVSQ